MKKILITLFAMTMFGGCFNSKENDETKRVVRSSIKNSHYEIVIDYSVNSNRKEAGAEYGKEILKICPDYEKLVDSYLCESIIIYTFSADSELRAKVQADAEAGKLNGIINENGELIDFKGFLEYIKSSYYENVDVVYKELLSRVGKVKKSLKQEYIDEISGIALSLSGSEDKLGDNKVSEEELFLLNLTTDVFRPTQCSAVAVFGEYSEDKNTIIGRNMEWDKGSELQVAKLAAVTTYINSDRNNICTVGVLGYMGSLTGFNDKGLFMANLDSETGGEQVEDFDGISSYVFDEREALERESDIETGYKIFLNKEYSYNFIIAMADKKESKDFECNISGEGTNIRRELRAWDSQLNEGVTWGIPYGVGAVNSFVLKGNTDNHKSEDNSARWETMKRELKNRGEKITFDELKEVIGYCKDGIPGSGGVGDLYSDAVCHSVMFCPNTMKLEISFASKKINGIKTKYEPVDVQF